MSEELKTLKDLKCYCELCAFGEERIAGQNYCLDCGFDFFAYNYGFTNQNGTRYSRLQGTRKSTFWESLLNI